MVMKAIANILTATYYLISKISNTAYLYQS